MNPISSVMLIRILGKMCTEINTLSLEYLLLTDGTNRSRLMYGHTREKVKYAAWLEHDEWLQSAQDKTADIKRYRELVKTTKIHKLIGCCPKSQDELSSLDEQFIKVFDEVFDKFWENNLNAIRSRVISCLREMSASNSDIDYIGTAESPHIISVYLVTKARDSRGLKIQGIRQMKEQALQKTTPNDQVEIEHNNSNSREHKPKREVVEVARHKTDYYGKLVLCTVADLEKKGLSKLNIAEQLLKNDRALFGDLGEHAGTKEQWAGQMERFGDNWMFLCDGTNVVGNWSCTFLTLAQELALKNGSMLGVNFTAEKAINPYISSDTEVAIHLLNISINDGYSTDENWALLWKSFGNRLCELAQKGIFYRSISACAFLPDYEEKFKKYGFKHIASRVGVGEVYLLDLTNGIPDKFCAIMPDTDLEKFYEEYWKTPVIFKQLSSNVPSSEYPSEQQLIMISSLVYDTDKYIYRAMMERSQAQKILPRVFASNKDPMFNLDNIFVAMVGEKIIGLILYKKGSLQWNSEHVRRMAMFYGEKLPKTLDKVEEEYFSNYSHTDDNTISIINCCVHSNWRMGNNRIGTKMMEAFCREHPEQMELYVLSETIPAMRIYERNGFELVNTCNGFSVDNRELPCGFMVRPAKTTK